VGNGAAFIHGHGSRPSGHSNTARMASAKINTRTHGSISLVIIAFRLIDIALALELAG
jgi:hypothetical protein